jgi:probable phosphoglycerate mutase
VKELILVRHAHALSNDLDVVSSAPPGLGLSASGRSEASALQPKLAGVRLDLAVATELLRTQETLALALGTRAVPTEIDPGLNEIRFGAYEGGALAAYRTWAWSTEPDDECPGGGESRVAAALRWAAALELLLRRSEERILAVTHGLPLRYAVDAAEGVLPAARMALVPHATPMPLSADQVGRAIETMRAWARAPRFTDG